MEGPFSLSSSSEPGNKGSFEYEVTTYTMGVTIDLCIYVLSVMMFLLYTFFLFYDVTLFMEACERWNDSIYLDIMQLVVVSSYQALIERFFDFFFLND